MEGKDHKETHLYQYVRAINKRKWTMITCLVVVVTTVAVWSFKMEPIYEATTQILIEKESPNVVSFQEVLDFNTRDEDYYQTQYKILKSRALARSVIEALALKESDEFSSKHSGFFNVKGVLEGLIEKVSSPKSLDEWSKVDGVDGAKPGPYDRLIDAFLKRMSVKPVRLSRLVKVSFEGYNPILVAKITNSLAQKYIDQNLETRFQASQHALAWLGEQLKTTKKKLEESETALQRYKEENKIISVSPEERRNFVVLKLNELSSDLTRAKTERIGLETLYNQLKKLSKEPGMVESIPDVIENLLIQDLKKEYSKVQAEYAELSKRYGEKNPKIIRVRSKLRSMEDKIAFEVEKITKGIETKYKVAKAKERSLRRALEAQKREALGQNKKAIMFRTLAREVDTNKQIYAALLKRAEETGLTSQLENVNIRIVDPAELPEKPVKPRVLLNLVLAMIAGLTMGTGLVFFLEYLDITVKKPEDIEELLGIHCLGAMGKFSTSGEAGELFVLADPKSSFSESIRTTRTNVVFSMESLKAKSLLVTSTGPEEGKSIIASNLAVSLAQMGKKVLLIDADLRKPRIHSIFGQPREPGFSCVLKGDIAKVMIYQSSVDNLKVLFAGQRISNPSELLSSQKVLELMNLLYKSFDYIILDSSPITAVTDALVISKVVDAVMVVIKSKGAPMEIVKRALTQLAIFTGPHSKGESPVEEGAISPGEEKLPRLIGAVLNFVDAREDYYYYHYDKYYRKYYSDEHAA